MDNGYVADIKKGAKENDNFRKVLFTTGRSQLVLMSLKPSEEIGREVHDGDQIIYIVDGKGFATIGEKTTDIAKGSVLFIPAGVQHNVENTDDEAMKLFTVYAPPQHKAGIVEREKDERWPLEAAPDADSEAARQTTS